MSAQYLCLLFCIVINTLLTNGAKLPPIDIQGSLQKDTSTSRQPRFLFGVSKSHYANGMNITSENI